MRLLDLHDELLVELVATGGPWTLEDLLHLSRACRKLHTVVLRQCGAVWCQLYHATFKKPMHPCPTQPGVAMQTFQDKYIAHSRKLRLERRVALMKLRSDLQHARTELGDLQRKQSEESAKRGTLHSQCQTLQQQMRVQSAQASQSWVPHAVRHSWDMVVTHAPVAPASRLRQLEQDLKTSKAVSQQLGKRIQSVSQTVATLAHRLKVLEQG